jgi:two-component system, LytTR family, sensor histidine kinase AlgZ
VHDFLDDPETPPPQRGFPPDFCRLPMIAGVALTAQLLGVSLTLAATRGLTEFWERLGPMSFFVLAISLLASATLCGLRPLLLRVRDRTAAVLAWLALVGVAGLVTWGVYTFTPEFLRDPILPAEGLPGILMRTLGISAILGGMLLRYLYLHHMWRLQVEAEAEARYQKLQARIRPHFLFNSMNTIANLTQTDPRIAEEVVQDLADLFRATLSNTNVASTLAKELELAYRYLNIEKQRLGDRLQVHWDVEDLPGDAMLPPLILQPLVENAVYHGIAASRRPGLIRIGGRYRRARVNVSVRNTLPAEDEPGDRHTSGNHMALDNVKQRMAAMFDGEARVIISRVEGDYQVRLVFPYPWKRQ